MRASTALKSAMLALALAGSAANAQSNDATPSSGVFRTAEQLYATCSSKEDAQRELCAEYIMGVYDTVTYMKDIEVINPSICAGDVVEAEDLQQTVLAYLEANERNFSAVSMVINALTTAYPCAAEEPVAE
ncbi:MAG TPA: Rap1a/Tai family immunity protein [Sphingomonadaceae bacterium]|nr:Rap1a/Tai family immunity protein [Sphingomonadaceae bacterium]